MDYCLVLTLIAVPITLATIIVFVETNKIEKQINKLHNKKREKIKTAKESPTFSWPQCDEKEMLDRKIEDYDLQIEGLERKRRFLLDKLPFLKK